MTTIMHDKIPENIPHLLVFSETEAGYEEALRLAERLHAPITREKSAAEQAELVLRLDADGLALTNGRLTLRGDFTHMLPRLRTGNLQRELLVRAAKKKAADPAPTAVDATAGLGEDALLLAAAGFSVRLYECNPVIAALLRDALRRASKEPELTAVVQRMQLFEEDSLTALPNLSSPPDLILLDPMFPARQKSALIKKKFQLLQLLEQPCTNEAELLEAALAAHPRKIVIKRPLKGPYLANLKPDYSLSGKAIRYDCFASSL